MLIGSDHHVSSIDPLLRKLFFRMTRRVFSLVVVLIQSNRDLIVGHFGAYGRVDQVHIDPFTGLAFHIHHFGLFVLRLYRRQGGWEQQEREKHKALGFLWHKACSVYKEWA